MKKTLTFLALAGFAFTTAQAQEDASVVAPAKPSTWSVGVHAGNFFLNPMHLFSIVDRDADLRGFNGDNTSFDIGYGLYIEKQISPIIGLQLGYDMGSYTGANSDYTDHLGKLKRHEYAEGDFSTISLNATVNFLNFTKKRSSNNWGLYFKGGASYMSFEGTRFFAADKSNPKAKGRSFSTDNELIFQAGLGLRYNVSDRFRVELESIFHGVPSGSLDLSAENKTDDKFDSYQYTTLGVAYTFGKGKAMHRSSAYSKENFWDKSLISENSQPDEERIKGIVGEEVKDEMEDIMATKKKMAELEAQIEAQRKAIEALKNKKPDSDKIAVQQVFQVFFASGSNKLSDQYQKELTLLAELMKENSSLKATVTGYTDRHGSEKLNSDLRQRRADQVKSFLVNAGISTDRLSTATSKQNIVGDNVEHLNRKVTIKFN
ncbi:MAG: OmpA family protein [Flavobacteriales bacterium]|jgi:OOP family OmpA-OmpF porin|nr:OmpA family protein [Flavobacteriales bacterium]